MTYRLRELNRRHLYLINIARDLKQSLQTGRVFIAAFALKSNRILTIGCNSYDDIGNVIAAKGENFDFEMKVN